MARYLKKESTFKVMVVIIIAFCMAIVSERILFATNEVKMFFGSLGNGEVVTLNSQDIVQIGYDIQEEQYVSMGEDPQLIKYDISQEVNSVNIYFKEPLEQNMLVAIYYSTDTLEFSEQTVKVEVANKGKRQVTIAVGENVKDLRIDIGNSIGQTFVLDKIVVNEKVKFNTILEGIFSPISRDRIQILFLMLSFILIHFIIDVKKMYQKLFRYRWLVGLGILVFLVSNRYVGSSIGMFDQYIQPGQGSEYIEPVFGEPRSIRSDEWMVDTPHKLSATFGEHPYGKYNEISMARQTTNYSTSGLYAHYSSLANPLKWGYFLFGSEYGFSMVWYGTIILAFLVSLEMCLIISKREKLLSVAGATLIVFSPFFHWWSFGPLWILTGQASLVCAYYFITYKSKFYKLLFAIGIAISGAGFVGQLYPAWQVPAGYLFLGVLIWMIIDNIEEIKKFGKYEWMLLVGAGIFCLSIIISGFIQNQEYMNSIMNTVYPGKRQINGYFGLHKVFYYMQSMLYPFKNIGNSSEASVFFSLYPIPTMLAIYLLIKDKKKDIFTTIILVISIVFTIYATVGLPMSIAKLTLLTYTLPERVVDVIGFIQVYLLVATLSRFPKEYKMPKYVSACISACVVILAIYFSMKYQSGYMPKIYILGMGIIVFGIGYVILALANTSLYKKVYLLLIIISVISTITIHPIMKGFDVIYSKPVAKKIQDIVQKDPKAKWITLDSLSEQQFLVACGAPTINSVNYMPNIELMSQLDPDGKYNEVYNRYAHIILILVEEDTAMELVQNDVFKLYLSYADLVKTGAEYIFTHEPIHNNTGHLEFNLIYDEDRSYIYQVQYLEK